MPTFRIAVIAGDGIGSEVIPAGIAALDAATRGTDVSLAFTEFSWGCEFYQRHGRMMDEDALDQLARFDAIYLGAIGSPEVPDHISLWDLILPIRQRFDQYVNLRPMRLLPGSRRRWRTARRPTSTWCACARTRRASTLASGGRIRRGTPHEVAEQTGVFTRHGIERIVRYAFELAQARPRQLLASATKSNALQHSMVLWDEVADAVRDDYPHVEYHQVSRRRAGGAHGHASADARRHRRRRICSATS